MFSWRAEMMAARSRAFIAGSGWPNLAATVISRASLPNSFDFWASCRPLRCMMFLNWEWPAMRVSLRNRSDVGGARPYRPPSREIKGLARYLVAGRARPPEYQAIVNHDFTPRCKDG